jgi:hypothetical protein
MPPTGRSPHRIERGQERREEVPHARFVEPVDVLSAHAPRHRIEASEGRTHSMIGGIGSAGDE